MGWENPTISIIHNHRKSWRKLQVGVVLPKEDHIKWLSSTKISILKNTWTKQFRNTYIYTSKYVHSITVKEKKATNSN